MKKSSIIICLFIGIMSFWSWGFMALGPGQPSVLASARFESLKYFTVLSNLLNAAAAFIWAGILLRGGTPSRRVRLLKLASTASVAITFLVVMVYLGPTMGYGAMFTGANLWLHLILPVVSIISFIALKEAGGLDARDIWRAAEPMSLYAGAYLANNLLNGIGEWPDTNDFYGFLHWGWGIGLVIALVIILAGWLTGICLWYFGRERRGS